MKRFFSGVFLLSLFLVGCVFPSEEGPTSAVKTPSAQDLFASPLPPATPNPPLEVSATPTPVLEKTTTPTAVARARPAVTSSESGISDRRFIEIPENAYRKIEFIRIGDEMYTDIGVGLRVKDVSGVVEGMAGPNVAFDILLDNSGAFGGKLLDQVTRSPDSELNLRNSYYSQGIYLKLLSSSAGLGQVSHATVALGPVSATTLGVSRWRVTPVNVSLDYR